MRLYKYPRTRHVEGSRLQPGDHDLSAAPFSELAGRGLVIEEKLDGANAAISFGPDGAQRLQSRGHYLTGGVREKHFNLLKTWASTHAAALWEVLKDRYVVYGEWLYAKHTIYYDRLPHYFLEFDVLDTHTGHFLATDRRRRLLDGLPLVAVPVLWTGRPRALRELTDLIGPSAFKTDRAMESLQATCHERALDWERVRAETEPSGLMEGLYIKVEEDGRVAGRYKFIRADFLTRVLDSGSHWLNRPIVPNRLADGVDLFAGGGEP